MPLKNKQTDKQTDSKILPTPTDIVGVGNYPIKSPETTYCGVLLRTVLKVQ